MLNHLIQFSLNYRFVVLLLTAILIFTGIQSARDLPLDAFPDTTPNQVQINTVAPALTPEEIERLITYPVELSLGGLKGLEEVRSISKFGLSQVVAIFSDDLDIYLARQQINERLGEVELPPGVEQPTMGPVATGLGEIYHYYVRSDVYDLTELRTIQDWVIRPRLRRVPGIAEINTLGGFAKQYEVLADPVQLAKYALTLDDVISALEQNNENVGGGPVESAGEVHLVQGVGLVNNEEEIADVVIKSVSGVPIRIRDVAEVQLGHAIRRGATTAEGRGEVILGLCFMRMGENSRDVTMALDEAMKEVQTILPPGVEIEVVYRRTDLVNHVLNTVEHNLFEGAILVIAILFAFLGNLRAGLIVASVIPLSMLFAVTMMQRIGIAGSLMSLGAIDFGLVVDSSVVMVENCVRHLGREGRSRPKLDIVRDAAVEVRKPTMFGELIIMVVYLPILTLEGVEGKMFRPMALTVIFALFGSMVLSLTLMPVLASLGLSRTIREKETFVDRIIRALYRPVLRLILRKPIATLVALGALTAFMFGLAGTLGGEFIPRLSEGSIAFETIRLPSIGLQESIRYGTELEKALLEEFPDEIEHIWTRTGTAEVATDPMGLELSDVFVMLTPREKWTRATSQEDVVNQMAEMLGHWPGVETAFGQPIEHRINEMVAGIRADLGIKIFGDDLATLVSLADQVEAVVQTVPGAADVFAEQVDGLPVLRVEIDRQALARYGVPARMVLDAVGAIGGIQVGEIREGERRFPLVVRLPESYRNDPESLDQILVPTPGDPNLVGKSESPVGTSQEPLFPTAAAGGRIPLTRLAQMVETTGAATIPREWGQRRIVVQANVRGRDINSFVQEAQARIAEEVVLPIGYSIDWGGQFENLIRARQRLYLVVPLALGLVLSLLYLSFHSLRDALIVFVGVLFAGNGGIFGLWYRGMPFTISAGVGFVALTGASMLMGLILVNAIHDLTRHGVPKQDAIIQASLVRLRPVLMTGAVAAFGFVPMMLSQGVGAEVQSPLATVVVSGMLSATILTMIALPVLYMLFGEGPEAASASDLQGEPRPHIEDVGL